MLFTGLGRSLLGETACALSLSNALGHNGTQDLGHSFSQYEPYPAELVNNIYVFCFILSWIIGEHKSN